jgi:restriction system protein
LHNNSLFAILLRSPWWVSFGVAAGLFALARLALPAAYAQYAIVVALPFVCIGGYVAWKQLQAPSAESVAARLEALRGLSWNEFSDALEAAFRRQGYEVERLRSDGADFALTRLGRVSIVSCKRWKVGRTGVEPLRELAAAGAAREAYECFYVAAGEVTDTARSFAAEHKIRLLHGAELATLLPR